MRELTHAFDDCPPRSADIGLPPGANVEKGGKNPPALTGILWPFGFGLSYTKFEYANLRIAPGQATANQDVAITFDVTNTGRYDGDEIPQLYVHQIVSSTITWEQSLRGFDRIHLKSGEKKTVTFHLSPSTLAIWNPEMVRVVEPGKYEIQIGASSTDLRLKGDLEIQLR